MKNFVANAMFMACLLNASNLEAATPAQPGQVPRSEAYVANPLNRTMRFATSCDIGEKKEWIKRQLKPMSSELYGCYGGARALSVRVVTGHNREAVRQLQQKKRYEFFWDTEKAQWDLREVTPRT